MVFNGAINQVEFLIFKTTELPACSGKNCFLNHCHRHRFQLCDGRLNLNACFLKIKLRSSYFILGRGTEKRGKHR